MRTKNTLIMAVAAAILVAAVYFIEIRGSEERAETERVADRLLRFETADVTGLNIETADTKIALQRVDDAWRITAPYNLAADDSAVDRIITRLQSADHDRLIDEAPDDLDRFGLEDPEVEVTVELDDGSSHSLALGNGTPVGFNVFVRPGGGDTVYTTAAGLKDAVNKTLFDLRDRSILTFDEPDVARLDLTTADLDASIERQPALGDGIARWNLTEPIEARADADTIAAYLRRLRNDRALAYPSDDPRDEDLATYGLDEPRLTVRVWTGDDSAITLEIGDESEDPGGYYARRLGSDAVFVAPTGLFEEAPDSVTALRNRTIVEFARDRVDGIEIDAGGDAIRLEKDGIDWRLVSPRALDGDAATVSSLLTATLGMKAAEFASGTADAARFGFATPHARLVFNLEPLPGEDAGPDQPAETITLLIGNATEIEPDEPDATTEDETGAATEDESDAPPEDEEAGEEADEEADEEAEEEAEEEADEEEADEPVATAARYVTVEGEPTVYVVEEDDISDVTVDLFALRSKTLVSFAQSNVSRIEVSGAGGTYELAKDEEGVWSPTGPAAGTDLTGVVDDMLWSLNYLRMEGIAAEPEGDDTVNLAPFGLDPPTMSLRAFVGDEIVAELSIGGEVPADELEDIPTFAPTTQTYGSVEGTADVFRIDAKLRDALQAIFDELS